MSSPQINAYKERTVNLVRSMVIKSSQTIAAQNNYLAALGYPVDVDHPLTWKYYLNLAGQYHESDEIPYIISSDTKARIPYTQEALAGHPITQLDYGVGGSYYQDLLNDYPKLRDVIPRVLNPVDPAMALDAPDYTLLYWNKNYVDSWETSLFRRVKAWIYAYMNRWHITSFALSDNLYPAAALGVLYLNLPLCVMGIREELSRTPEASSFHIWSYLGGRFELDRYKDYLTHEQALFLYNNIDYLRFHVGKEQTLLTLLQRLAKPVNIEAKRFDIVQKQDTKLDKRHGSLLLLRNPYESARPDSSANRREALTYGLDLTLDKARDNAKEYIDDEINITQAVEDTNVNFDPTGLVELTINQPPPERQMNPGYQRLIQWISLVHRNKLFTTHQIDIAGYGEITLTAKEALLVFMYAVSAAKRIPLTHVPTVHIADTLTTVKPTADALDVYVPVKYREGEFGRRMLAHYRAPTVITSTKGFETHVNNTVMDYYHTWTLSNLMHDAKTRSGLKTMLHLLYPGEICILPETGSEYLPLLEALDIPTGLLTSMDYYALALEIMSTVIGLDIDGNGITNKHKAIIDIIGLLASYNIVFGEGVGLKPRLPYHYAKIEPGDTHTHYENNFRGNILPYGGDATGRVKPQINHHISNFTLGIHRYSERPKTLAFSTDSYLRHRPVRLRKTLAINDLAINVDLDD